ncbi:SURF1 family protein [Spectribacter hydrogenoxidans]|uniref:SURF1-like protein n=1 Tax=Spectribacter hydrogenoxidans TaxID=3075608 RepID=A0ABU3BYB8_9GAMM|nr:SURF1 family protein [Salinisphaera sp. W335]MDT0634235.1 SURF1 family protein [Salinisphaera sp. W335]
MRFRPPWWAWLVFLPGMLVLGGLGTWQLQRAQDKQAILEQRSTARQAEPMRLADATEPASQYGRRVVVSGGYLAERQLLLDNQIWQSAAGYRVWTPLRLDDGRLVFIDRGWVPRSGDRTEPPRPDVPAGRQRVTGLWRSLPEPGMRLAAPDACEQSDWPRVLNYPTAAQVECQYEAPVLAGIVLLDESLPDGFERDWQSVGIPPQRHIGYAVQWYAMALAVLVIFLIMNTKRRA